jgi:hypothetical protein
MAHPFIVGETYFDRKGNFVVLSIEQSTMRFRYDDGTEQTADIAIKATIYRNMLAEQRDLHPVQTPGYFETLGFFARHADFQAEVPAQAQRGFEEQYSIFAGVRPVLGHGGYYPVRTVAANDKWGPELRIYFPQRATIEIPAGIEVRTATTDGIVRINNNDFWRQLVRVGFRLGTQHQIAAIRNSIPAQFHADFEQGLQS